VFVTGGGRSGSAERAGKEREKREERKEKREKKRKKGKRNGEGKEKWEKGKGRGRVRASGDRGRGRTRAALVTRARARGGEARRAGWPLAAGKREAGPSVLGRGGEGERRERKREEEVRSDDRDGWLRVGDKRACDAGWDGGEEKERRVRSAEKGQMDTSKGIRCWKTGVWDGKEFPGIRVLGFRRISSSTLEIF